ncbi:MAG: hypothetical protein K2Q23_00845 [Bryobacteraceae bacterium]|nr:hypothetical protein [Bryobacteraceae bacterium]
MLPILGTIASSVLGAGPIQGILGGILGGGNPVAKAIGGLAKGIGKLFGKKRKKPQRPPTQLPNPFQLPGAAFQNLTKKIQNLTGQLNTNSQNLGKILDLLKKWQGQTGQAGPAAGGPGGIQSPFNPQQIGLLLPAVQKVNESASRLTTSLDASIDRVGNKAQSLMDQAQKLAESDNPADQMKAQRMMQQAQRMMEFMSNMIKIIGDMQKNAIQNMR